jgi:hypothetical protein
MCEFDFRQAQSVKARPIARHKSANIDPAAVFGLTERLVGKLDTWAAQQEDKPNRGEALRRLLRIGLSGPAEIDRGR